MVIWRTVLGPGPAAAGPAALSAGLSSCMAAIIALRLASAPAARLVASSCLLVAGRAILGFACLSTTSGVGTCRYVPFGFISTMGGSSSSSSSSTTFWPRGLPLVVFERPPVPQYCCRSSTRAMYRSASSCLLPPCSQPKPPAPVRGSVFRGPGSRGAGRVR